MSPTRAHSALDDPPNSSSLTALVLELHQTVSTRVSPRSDGAVEELAAFIASASSIIPLLEQQQRARSPRMKEAQDIALRHLSTAKHHIDHSRRECECCKGAFELARRNLLHALETLLAVLAPYAMTGLLR